MKILLVDDNEMLLVATSESLRRVGHHVTCAVNGQEALHSLRYPFDIVITDWEMPTLDGDALCRAIKEKYPGTPVVLVSGNFRVHNLECGADAVVDKPYSSRDLRTVIDRLASITRGGEALEAIKR